MQILVVANLAIHIVPVLNASKVRYVVYAISVQCVQITICVKSVKNKAFTHNIHSSPRTLLKALGLRYYYHHYHDYYYIDIQCAQTQSLSEM